jgi:transcriptional regulator with XRE-family HTH domain
MTKGYGNQTLGDYIRSRRSSVGLSLSDAADASDLDPSYWNKLENGHYNNPAPQHLSTIASVLGIPVADLYGLAGYEIPDGLPSFQPYLRAKYDLPAEAIADLERYFELLRNYYGVPEDQPVFPPKPTAEVSDASQEAA